MAMYAAGRRYGASWTERRFHLKAKESADDKLSRLYERYGLISLAIGRFIPGVRAVVAPFAGALRAPVIGTVAAITLASASWYGLVTWAAFNAGSNWEELVGTLGRLGRVTALVAFTLIAAIGLAWYRHRRRKSREPTA
jgi:membrane protein DedA with SNARE-associated domain